MDKIKNLNDLGVVSITAIKKLITNYTKPKFRIFVVPTITTVLMKV